MGREGKGRRSCELDHSRFADLVGLSSPLSFASTSLRRSGSSSVNDELVGPIPSILIASLSLSDLEH